MPKKVRSAKGQIVDFDLMKIKQQLGDTAEPTNVQARKDFIDAKLRRRMRKIKKTLDGATRKPVEPNTTEVAKNVAVEAAPQSEMIDEVAEPTNEAPKKTSTTKRKIKRKTTTDKGE